jgi:flagellar protein FliO/FliZ
VTELVLRIGLSLLAVLGLMWVTARLVRRPLSRRSGGVLHVLARHQLSRGSSVAVLRVLDRALVLGVTDQQVTLLGETDLAAVELETQQARRGASRMDGPDGIDGPDPLAPSALSRRTWSQALEQLRDRTVRKP